MRKLIMLMAVMCLFCLPSRAGNVQMNEDTTSVVLDTTPVTIGYLIGKENPEQIDQWIDWGEKLLAIEPGFGIQSYEELLALGIELTINDPFLELQMNKLMALLEFPDLPVDTQFLDSSQVTKIRIVIKGFLDGLLVASK